MPQQLPRFRRFEEHAADIDNIAKITESGSTALPVARGARLIGHRSAEGDADRLRGLPMFCTERGGTMRGTDPAGQLVRNEARHG